MNEHTLNMRIPQGVKEGRHIRLAGQGSPESAATRRATCIWKCISIPIPIIAWMGGMCT